MEWNGRAQRGVEALCKRRGLDMDIFDWKAHWDSSLEYRENMTAMENYSYDLKPKTPEEMCASKEEVMEQQKRAFLESQASKQTYISELFSKATERTGEGAEILEEISKFNPHAERITLSTMMAVNQSYNVINLSPPGLGKSRGVKELLDVLDVPYTEFTGHLAPTDFYEKLKAAKGLVVIDESATLLKNTEILNLLLSALWTRKISWRDDEAIVDANIIFNTNHLPGTEFAKALTDRCQFNVLRLPADKVRNKILTSFDYKPNPEIWKQVRTNMFVRAKLDGTEFEKLKDFLRVAQPKSVRERDKLFSQARFCKSMFGTIDYVKLFVDVDRVAEILDSDLPRAEKAKAIAEAENVTLRTAQRWMAEEKG